MLIYSCYSSLLFSQGFYCKDENDFDDLCQRLRKVSVHLSVFGLLSKACRETWCNASLYTDSSVVFPVQEAQRKYERRPVN